MKYCVNISEVTVDTFSRVCSLWCVYHITFQYVVNCGQMLGHVIDTTLHNITTITCGHVYMRIA